MSLEAEIKTLIEKAKQETRQNTVNEVLSYFVSAYVWRKDKTVDQIIRETALKFGYETTESEYDYANDEFVYSKKKLE